jgi:hypothetical protein
MKLLIIPFVSSEMDHEKTPVHAIGIEPWPNGKNPECEAIFRISHFNQGIRLQYAVTESFLRVKKRKPNGDVHLDNCVEFFLGFENEASYYNFEFNCLGSVKGAFGKDRINRKRLPTDLLTRIENDLTLSLDNITGKLTWNITIVLPIEAFCFHTRQTLRGVECTANFTKCGDDLPVPHFLSWVDIPTEWPDFHRPDFFGKVTFEASAD